MAATPKKQPIRLSSAAAIVCGLAFGGLALWPYLSRATERFSQGKSVSVSDVRKDVEKSERQKMREMEKDKAFEPKSVFAQPDGTLLVGGKAGLKELRDGKLVPVENFGGMDVRGLTMEKGVLWAAAKDGIWKKEGAEWKNVKSGDFFAVNFDQTGRIYAAGKQGVFQSSDAVKWELVPGTESGAKPEHD